jgi:hypothetical protein
MIISLVINYAKSLHAEKPESPMEILAYFGECCGEVGGVVKLWAEAAVWSVGVGSSSSNFRHLFRKWVTRAAMARGHAEWLLMERDVCFSEFFSTRMFL